MGAVNSRRARRRRRGKLNAGEAVFWFGRWMRRTITEETVELGNGFVCTIINETWTEANV